MLLFLALLVKPLATPNYLNDMDNFDEKLKQLNKEWCEAGYKESVIREFAFLNITHEICGVELQALTPLHFILLDFVDSPFVNPRDNLQPGDIFQFLYVVSTDYKRNDKSHYEAFVAKHADIDISQAVSEICDYINDAFLDAPAEVSGGKNTNNRPYTAWIVPYIDLIASEYGWDDETIIRLPFTRLFQYAKSIDMRKSAEAGQKAICFNRYSDSAKQKISNLLNEKAKTQGKTVVE